MARRSRRPSPQTAKWAHLPAPTGGINTIDAGSAMPAEDCVYAYNLIAAEYGLRSRLGYQGYASGLDGEVRTVIPFHGSRADGATNKLFACTKSGIWDVTTAAGPAKLITFADQDIGSGFGVFTSMTTPAGHWLLYADESNGLHLWSENSSSWVKVALGTTQLWAGSTSYLVGNTVVNGSKVYTCTVAGISAASGGPTGTGAGIVDGAAHWNYVSASATSTIGPSLADQQAGYTGDPAGFAFVTVWKNRVWLVEKNSTRGWYLDINAIFGTATSFSFGSKMRAGGPLVGLWNWSYDAGGGLDTLLVGISTAGDVVIYNGTDPTTANAFSLTGCWFMGAVPSGRRIATDYGGDLLVLSLLGVVQLSKLVVGQPVVAGDRSLYATGKIQNLFNLLASQASSLPGWALHVHPTDNALLVVVPTGYGVATQQLAMSFSTRGWSRYRDLPLSSAGIFEGQMYFGTPDGRVVLNTGYADGSTVHGGDVGGVWTASTSFSITRAYAGVAIASGNVYLAGGWSGDDAHTPAVSFAAIQPDGSLGAWANAIDLPNVSRCPDLFYYNGFFYHAGTNDAGGDMFLTHAPLNVDGTIGAWVSDSLWAGTHPDLGIAAFAILNGYIYGCGGGFHDGLTLPLNALVHYAPINSDGTMGAWATTTSLPVGLDAARAFVSNGRLYVAMGDTDGVALDTNGIDTQSASIYMATPNANGTLGTWSVAGTVAAASGSTLEEFRPFLGAAQDTVYYYCGDSSGGVSVGLYWAALDPTTGLIGTFSLSAIATPAARGNGAALLAGQDNLYLLGGIYTTGTDYVAYSNSDSVQTPVQWSLLTAFRNEDGRNKRVQLIRPTILSESPAPTVQATAKYGFDLSESALLAANVANASSTWDGGLWDLAIWGGAAANASQALEGGSGMGRDVALAIQGSAVSRTTLVGVDVLFDEGGYL